MGSSAATSAGRRRAGAPAAAANGRPKPKRGSSARGSRPGRTKAGAGRSRPSARSAAARRPGAKPTSGRRPAWRRRLAIAGLVLVALVSGYLFWLRDSSLVAVTDVTVEGVETSERERIVAELTEAAEAMTTLNVDGDRLAAVGRRFPTVESVSADPSLPRSLTITVVERPPAVVARVEGEETAVAADGTVLPGVEPAEGLPRLDVDRLPRAGRLRGQTLARALVAATAPEPLRRLIRSVRESPSFGIEARMRGGISLRFGPATGAEAKWAAAAAVLADPSLDTVSYVDLRVPQRPAVGGAEPVAAAGDPAELDPG